MKKKTWGGKRKGSGRKDEGRNQDVTITLTSGERATLEMCATTKGLTLSRFIGLLAEGLQKGQHKKD